MDRKSRLTVLFEIKSYFACKIDIKNVIFACANIHIDIKIQKISICLK